MTITNMWMQLLHMLLCYDRLSSEHVLVITSCTARARHKYKLHHLPKKSTWALPIFYTAEPVTLKKPCLFHTDFNHDFNHDFLHNGTPL